MHPVHTAHSDLGGPGLSQPLVLVQPVQPPGQRSDVGLGAQLGLGCWDRETQRPWRCTPQQHMQGFGRQQDHPLTAHTHWAPAIQHAAQSTPTIGNAQAQDHCSVPMKGITEVTKQMAIRLWVPHYCFVAAAVTYRSQVLLDSIPPVLFKACTQHTQCILLRWPAMCAHPGSNA